MDVTLKGITESKDAFVQAGVELPQYDVAAVQKHTARHPVWVHCGAGNIFRGFVASLQQDLLKASLRCPAMTARSSMRFISLTII